MPRVRIIHDTNSPDDVVECEIWEGNFILTSQDNTVRNGTAVSIMLDKRGALVLRQHLDQLFGDYPDQTIAQLIERLKNAEEENKGAQAMIHVLAEGKDLLRRELDQRDERIAILEEEVDRFTRFLKEFKRAE